MTLEGQLFSAQYADHGAALSDSKRFRVRLATAYELNFPPHTRFDVADAIRMQLGVEVPFGYGGYLYSEFFEEAELRDVLDAITIIFNVLSARHGDGAASLWRDFVKRTFETENLRYVMDGKGGVHRVVDGEYERNRTTVMASLQAPKYSAVADALAKSFANIGRVRSDAKSAVQYCFGAVETLAQVLCGADEPLDRTFVEKRIRPAVEAAYRTDAKATGIAADILSSFGSWVDAVQGFSRASGTKAPVVVPNDLAVLLVSNGAAFIRWLVQMDQRGHEKL